MQIVGEETSPDDTTAYLVSVQTEAASDLGVTGKVAAELNAGPMRFPSLAGPIYISDSRTLRLCTTARVHAQTVQWMGLLLVSVSLLQLNEARMLGAGFAGMGTSAALAALNAYILQLPSAAATNVDLGITVECSLGEESSLSTAST